MRQVRLELCSFIGRRMRCRCRWLADREEGSCCHATTGPRLAVADCRWPLRLRVGSVIHKSRLMARLSRSTIVNVGHDEAHAGIYFASPFEEATVLVMDGYGDDAATSTFTGKGHRLAWECALALPPDPWVSAPVRDDTCLLRDGRLARYEINRAFDRMGNSLWASDRCGGACQPRCPRPRL